ncbi:MAG: hypothetical protein V4731_17350, partial [Pseudomonadota bacterium]
SGSLFNVNTGSVCLMYQQIEDAAELEQVLIEAIAAVKNGATIVIDVVVQTGYSPAMTVGLTRSED